ncbi:Gfo/Idh/MocA family oxidoreductase [Streptomyces collinus]|uniref:Gfo/Idh/MocA family protein n=1 Tax=Streptomyces TaxID=1883 RepID=UPI0033DE5416
MPPASAESNAFWHCACTSSPSAGRERARCRNSKRSSSPPESLFPLLFLTTTATRSSHVVPLGIAGTGAIANGFTDALGRLPDAQLVAVGSRSRKGADAFGEKHGIAPRHRHASYEDLAADDSVDVVYVASPHSHHHEHTLLFLNAGRPVLCEKAFALDAEQASEMVAGVQGTGPVPDGGDVEPVPAGLCQSQRTARRGRHR